MRLLITIIFHTMRETIQIKNLGALKDTGVIDIRSMTVFIGNSASGKSTLMKTLALMRYIFKRLSIRAYLRNSHVEDKVFYIRFKDYLRDNMIGLVDSQTYIHYDVTINNHTYSATYSNGKLTYNAQIHNGDLCFFKEVWVAESRSAIAPLSSQGTLARNVSLGYFFNETLSEFNAATDAMRHFDLSYVGLDMDVVRGGNNQKKYMLKPQDNNYPPFELRHASSGIQTTAPLVAMVNYYAYAFDFKAAQKRSIIDFLFDKDLTTTYRPEMELTDMPKYVHIHIEEPELSLDPTSQIKLLNEIIRLAFKDKADRREIGLVFATHSPYLINSLNLLMKAYDCNENIDGASLDYDNLSVYQVVSGTVTDLKIRNIHYINTDRLSEDINFIYDKYQELKRQQDEKSLGK